MEQISQTHKMWLKATYLTHVFHYRLPQTAAIAADNPSIPSPLTVKMAIVAGLLRNGEISAAQAVAKELPQTRVLIRPSDASLVFKAFLRYRSPPAIPDKGPPNELRMDETGSLYPSRPHMREYAILSNGIEFFLEIPASLKETCKQTLLQIPYLGCKDSLVTCTEVEEVNEPSEEVASPLSITPLRSGIIWHLADFNSDAKVKLIDLIPTEREEGRYTRTPYLVRYESRHWGRTTLYFRR